MVAVVDAIVGVAHQVAARSGIEPNATLIFEVELLSIVDKNKDDQNKNEKKDDKSEERK